jgi:hypothetical protein
MDSSSRVVSTWTPPANYFILDSSSWVMSTWTPPAGMSHTIHSTHTETEDEDRHREKTDEKKIRD